jgi:hypothetical protein
MKSIEGKNFRQRLWTCLSLAIMLAVAGMMVTAAVPYRGLPWPGEIIRVYWGELTVNDPEYPSEITPGVLRPYPIDNTRSPTPYELAFQSTSAAAQVAVLHTVDISYMNLYVICLAQVRVEKVLALREGFPLKAGDIRVVVLPGGSCQVANYAYPRVVASGDHYVLLLRDVADCASEYYDILGRKTQIDLAAVGDQYFTATLKSGSADILELNRFAEFFALDEKLCEGWGTKELADFFEEKLSETAYVPEKQAGIARYWPLQEKD